MNLESGIKIMIVLLACIMVFPIIFTAYDFIIANWLYFLLIVGVLIGSFFAYKQVYGGSGNAQKFHNIP